MTDPDRPARSVRVRGWAVVVAAVVLGTLAIGYGRAVVESSRYARLGDAALADGDTESAVLHYRHAVQWHAPVLGAGPRAFDALVAIGDQRGAAADTVGALFAYRSARAAAMAVRHLSSPYAGQLPALHQKIGGLMAAQVAGAAPGDAARAARYTAELDAYRDRQPNTLLGLLAGLLFLAWIGAMAAIAIRGFDRDGRIIAPALVRWSTGAVICLVGWIVCVRFA